MNLVIGFFIGTILVALLLEAAIRVLSRNPNFFIPLSRTPEYRAKNDIKTDHALGRAIILALMLGLGYKLIFASFHGLIDYAVTDNRFNWLALVYCYAWLCYLTMGIFWVMDKKLGRFIPATGTLAGTFSVISISWLILPLFFVAPHVVFAYSLAKYHISRL